MEDVKRKMQLLTTEDFIWLIYFFIVIFSLIANSFSESYLITKNKKERNAARNINITLLIIAFFIYLYFVLVAIDDINILKPNATGRQRKVAMERLITTLVFLVGGALSIYTELDDNQGDIDLAIF